MHYYCKNGFILFIPTKVKASSTIHASHLETFLGYDFFTGIPSKTHSPSGNLSIRFACRVNQYALSCQFTTKGGLRIKTSVYVRGTL